MMQLELTELGGCKLFLQLEIEMFKDWDSGFPFDLLTEIEGLMARLAVGRVVEAEYKFGEEYEPHDWTKI